MLELPAIPTQAAVTEPVNHVSGSRSGIVGVYQRHGWEEEKAAALRAWAAHVISVAKRNSREGDSGSSPGRSS